MPHYIAALDDLGPLLEDLESIQAKWYNFGLQLKVDVGKLDGIAVQCSNPLDCLRETLKHWLKTSLNCTWKCIVDALGSSIVGANALALELKRKHCPQLDTHVPQAQSTSMYTPQHPHMQSVKPTPAMAKYAQYLRACYTRSSLPDNSKFPPTPSKQYVNLAYIPRRTVSKHESDKFKVAMVRGEIDKIARDKGLDFSHVAQRLPDGSYPQVVLVEGAPGVGKTTFAWEFCKKWGKGELKQEYSLVILLRLRYKRIQEAKCLRDLFYHPDETLPDVIVTEVINSLGEGVLIILEGLDELPESQRTETSVFLELIYGRLLPNATILVTTRPWASEYLHRNCKEKISQHVEILGFTKQQIKNYLRSVCKPDDDPSLLSDIEKYLSCYPHIHAAMYIPLNAAIVVQVYRRSRTGECIIPKTMTQLYTALSQTLLIRYLEEHPVHGKTKWNIHNFSDLPSDVYEHFLQLSKVAYDGIKNDQKLVFSSEDLPQNLDTLGFMQSVPELYVNESLSHHFLHLTIQEYLAAVYIAQLSPEEQLEHFKERGGDLFKVVMRFVAGLTKLSGIPSESVRGFFGKPHDASDPCTKYSKYWVKCDYSVHSDHVNWMFETQDPGTINAILGSGNTIGFVCKSNLMPFGYYCLGYCIAHSHCPWSLMFNETITREDVNMLTLGGSTLHISKQNASIVSIKCSTGYNSMCTSDVAPEELAFKILPINFHVDLEELIGFFSDTDFHTDFQSLIRLLRLCPSLKVFQWEEIAAINCVGDLRELCDLLASPSNSLEMIRIAEAHYNDCEDDDHYFNCSNCCVYHADDDDDEWQVKSMTCVTIEGTYQHTSVSVDVHISSMNDITHTVSVLRENSNQLHFTAFRLHGCYWFDSDLACRFAEALHDTTTLETLKIYHNPIGTEGAMAIAKLIHNNTSLKEVSVKGDINIKKHWGCSSRVTPYYIRVHVPPSLEWTYATCTISVGVLRELCDLLASTYNSLDIIKTDDDSFGRYIDSCVTIEGTYQHTSVSVNVHITSVDDVISTISILKKNSNLKLQITAITIWAGISRNHCESIDGALACRFAEALHDTTTLKTLELIDHPIGTKGAIAIVKLIHNNKSLETVEVRGDCAEIILCHLNRRRIDPSPKVLQWTYATCAISVGLLREMCGLLASTSNSLDIIQTYDDAYYDEPYVRIEGTYQHTSVLVDVDISSVHDVSIAVSVLTENSNLGLHLTAIRMWNLIEDIDGDLACRLAKALHGTANLKTLELINHPIGTEGAMAIVPLICNNKSLEAVKMSYCNIGDEGACHLAQALIENTTLRRLDFSGNSIGTKGAMALATLICNNKSLEEVRMSKNKIDGEGACYLSQALRENTTVRKLDLSFNPIGTKGTMAFAETTLCNNRSLEVVDMRNCNIDSEGACHLAWALCENTTLSRLDLSYNPIGTNGAVALANTIRITKSLEEVHMKCCDIDSEGACHLAKVLCENTTLSTLDLSFNPIGTNGAVALANTICTTKSLEEVHMKSCDIKSEGICPLAQAFCENTTLRIMDLSGNLIETKGAMPLATLLRNDKSQKVVLMSKNNFEGAYHLTLGLCDNTIVRQLDLALNPIGTEVAMALAELIHSNKSLVVVHMRNCTIGIEGICPLAQAFCENTSLRIMDLSGNPVGAMALATLLRNNKSLKEVRMSMNTFEGTYHLSLALCDNTAVRKLDLALNPVGTEVVMALAELMHSNKSLEEVDLRSCSIGSEGACHLAQALRESNTLRKLDLSYNPIRTKGALALAELIHDNKSLEEVDMRNCNVGSEGACHLAQALCKNYKLRRLDLSYNPIRRKGAVALAELIRPNKLLEGLDICRCKIGAGGACHLAQALFDFNARLKYLNLSGNPIGQKGANALAVMLYRNRSLQKLDLYMDTSLGEQGTCDLLKAMTVANTSLQELTLPSECQEYAKSFPKFSEVSSRVIFNRD